MVRVYESPFKLVRMIISDIWNLEIICMEKWLWQKISEKFSRLKNIHVSLLLMNIFFYLLTHGLWLLNHLIGY